jgi:hypothetical protein
MEIWRKIKIYVMAFRILSSVYFNFMKKIAILDPERLDGNGNRNSRLLRPVEKAFRDELSGKKKLSRSDLARLEFLGGLSIVDKDELPEGLEDTIKSLLLWACDLRTRANQE